jgi:predicted transglutaminase-like cysteine proteinase
VSERLELLRRVHEAVDRFPYETDAERYGQADFWERISAAGLGDCEDYVLEKRARLMEAGVPAQDMRIGLLNIPKAGCHAVLIVRDGDVDWVSDQTQPHLLTREDMKRLGYEGIEIQHPGRYMWERWEI